MLAAVLVTVAHEAIGHGAACLASGGRIVLLTSVYFRCGVPSPWIDWGGPAGNLMAGTAALLVLTFAHVHRRTTRLLLTLIVAFSFAWEAGYLLYSAALGQGDWASAARAALGPGPQWRAVCTMAGLALYVAARRATAAGLGSALGSANEGRWRASRAAWIAATVSTTAAAAAYAPDRLGAMGQAFLEIGAASAPLLLAARRRPAGEPAGEPMGRQAGWLWAAVLVYAVFVATLGRGVR